MKRKKIKTISITIMSILTLLSANCITDFRNFFISYADDVDSNAIKSEGITYELTTDKYFSIKPDDSVETYAVVTACDYNIKSIVIPDTINGYPVREISSGAFRDHEELEMVSIPDSVRIIGFEAFYGTKVPSFVDGWLLSKEDRTYFWSDVKDSRQTFFIKEGVKGISDGLFDHSISKYTSYISFPSTLKYIGNGAFDNCEGIHSIILPESVEYIGAWAFHTCLSLKSVTILNPDCWIRYNYNLNAQTFYPSADIYGYRDSTAREYEKYNSLSFHVINSKSALILADLSEETNNRIRHILLNDSYTDFDSEKNDYDFRFRGKTNVMDLIRAKREFLDLAK